MGVPDRVGTGPSVADAPRAEAVSADFDSRAYAGRAQARTVLRRRDRRRTAGEEKAGGAPLSGGDEGERGFPDPLARKAS